MTVTAGAEVDLDKKINQAMKALDLASHPDTPPEEADAARKFAAQIMDRYDILESMLDKARPAERVEPILKRIPVRPFGNKVVDSDIGYRMTELLQLLAGHCHVRLRFDWMHEELEIEGGETMKYYTAAAVGYPNDIRYLEVLYAQLRLHIISNLAARWNKNESLAENTVRLHEAGVGYDEIADLAFAAGFADYDAGEKVLVGYRKRGYTPMYERPRAKGVKAKLMRVYDAYCKENGRQKIMTPNPDNYRRFFLSGYVSTIRRRVWTMNEQRRETMREVDLETGSDGGSAIALRDRVDVVNEAFYNFYPDERPQPAVKVVAAPASKAKTRRRGGGPGSRGGRVPRDTTNYTALSAGSTVAKTADLSGGRNHLNGKKALGS